MNSGLSQQFVTHELADWDPVYFVSHAPAFYRIGADGSDWIITNNRMLFSTERGRLLTSGIRGDVQQFCELVDVFEADEAAKQAAIERYMGLIKAERRRIGFYVDRESTPPSIRTSGDDGRVLFRAPDR